MTRPRILMFGYLPPPYFGPSVAYRALMHSEFPQRFEIAFVDITVSRSIGDIERFRVGKIINLLGLFLRELWLLTTHRFDFCCCPVSVNRNAFIRDAALLGLARVFSVPTVLYAHGNNIPDFCDHAGQWMQRLIARTCRDATGAIVLGDSLRFNFERWLPAERIFVAPIGIEPQPDAPAPQRRSDQVTVLYLGNLVREKGVFVLLESAAAIVGLGKNVQFVFAGHWYRREEELAAQEFVASHQLEAHVRFVGSVVGAAKWQTLANADILAFPTFYYYETMGLVVLEAMQAGVPVVATRRGSLPEIVRDGIDGLLVEEQSATDLAEKILRLADDAALREQMGLSAKQRFQSYYTHLHYGQRMAQVFEQLDLRRDKHGCPDTSGGSQGGTTSRSPMKMK